MGAALYDDKYQKIDGKWRIGFSEYDRIWEEVSPINPETKFNSTMLCDIPISLISFKACKIFCFRSSVINLVNRS